MYGENIRTLSEDNPKILAVDIQPKTDNRFFKAITNMMDNQILNKRAVLIFFETEAKLEEFRAFLKSERKGANLVKTMKVIDGLTGDEMRKQYIYQAATRSQLTLLTRPFGRGTDFVIRDKELMSKGLFVIQTFFSQGPARLC